MFVKNNLGDFKKRIKKIKEQALLLLEFYIKMEKPVRSKRPNFLTFLAKSTSFSNPAPPMKHAQYHNKGFSGPILHLVPDEARRKQKTDTPFETQEPTSPTVSCIGQIKQQAKKNKLPRAKSIKKHAPPKPERKPSSGNKNSLVQRMFGRKPPIPRRKLEVSRSDNMLAASTSKAPRIDHMKRFKSGRDSLRDFDWTKVEREIKGIDSKEDDDMSVYYSAPLVYGGHLEPRKEVNLWKRRTIGAPVPLKLEEL
jgi:hypothetical protein